MEHPTLSDVREFIEERLVWYGKSAEFWNDEKRTVYALYEDGKVYALEEVLEFLKGERK